YEIQVQAVSRQDRERDSGCIPGSDMAHCDAAGVNGSNRILSHGAPPRRMMPNGCLESPVLVLLPVLTEASSWMSDRGAQGAGGSKPSRICSSNRWHCCRHEGSMVASVQRGGCARSLVGSREGA